MTKALIAIGDACIISSPPADNNFHWTARCYLRFKPYHDCVPIYISAFGPEYFTMSGAGQSLRPPGAGSP